MSRFWVGVTILILLMQGGHAAIISVDGNCNLNDAIIAANDNSATGQCIAGDDVGGPDTILLTVDVVLSTAFEDHAQFGKTGTPAISSNIVLDGQGHIIERDPALSCALNSIDESGEFRLMRVENPGNLDLRDSILKNGCADSSGGVDAKIGGGVLNFNANLEVSNSIFLDNAAEFRGGAVDTTFGNSTVTNSYYQDNFTNFGGGALSNFTSITNISESTFYRNTAGSRGGAIFNVDGTGQVQQSTLILISNTFSLNISSGDGGALYNENAEIVGSVNNTLASNVATNFGGAIYNTSTGTVDISAFLFTNNGGGVVECFNNGGSFVSNEGLTDNNAGGCANNESSSINLLSLSDNGCTTPLADGTCIKTHGLGSGSFAINPAVHFLGTDQRGFSIVGRHDVGAYEFLTGGQQCTQLGFGVSITPNGFSASVATDFELNQAISCANLDSTDTDTILLTEDITLDKLYVANDGKGATGTVLISTPMIIDGNNHKLQRNLNFTCDIDNNELDTEFRLMKVTKTGDLDLRNISLENGCADSSGPLSRGGGILNNGLLAINHSTISNNRADFGAGISNSIVSGGAVPNISSLDSVIISDNIAGFKGGGIENTLATITLIKNSIIKNNQALSGTNGNGGGIFNDSNSSIDTISNSSIVNNTAGFDGAGIFNDFTITSLFDTTFSGNTAANFGGGIRNQGGINLISNSTFSSNRANKGGAVYTSGNIAEIQHSTFHKNQADSNGGALLSSAGISEVNNSLFVQNLGTRQDCSTENNGDINGSNNLSNTSGSNNNCDATIAGSLDSSTVGELADNGCHGNPLADGGCNKTHALSSSSQAINFIANTSLLLDQRRFSVEDGQRDAGAYEFIPPSALCSQAGINTNVAFTSTPVITSEFTLAISCANANNATTDTINFGADIVLAQAFENIDTGNLNDVASKGRTGTPAITSPLIINGMGFSLMRDTNLTCGSLSSNSPEDPNRFRLLRIADTGSLELSNITIANGCVSQNSQVHKFYGGGIYNQGDLSVTDSVFANNGAATGAGIYNFQGTVSQISNSIFDHNDVPDFLGAGISNDEGQINSIVNNAFIQNNAFFGGGGIANANNGTINSIARNTFDKNNSVFAGAGIYNLLGADIISIENNTFSGNTGSHAISNESLISEISNCTFVNNGIGIHTFTGTINTINNSIIDACLTQNGGVLNGSNNLSDDINHSCPGTTRTQFLNLNANLQNNGCTVALADGSCVLTHAILPESEAIDAGDGDASGEDQRGFSVTGVRDIGAYESNFAPSDALFRDGFEG